MQLATLLLTVAMLTLALSEAEALDAAPSTTDNRPPTQQLHKRRSMFRFGKRAWLTDDDESVTSAQDGNQMLKRRVFFRFG